MEFKKYMPHLAFCAFAVLAPVAVLAESENPQTWAQDIALMTQMTPEDAVAHQAEIARIRAEIQDWIDVHPGSSIQLPAAPAQLTPQDAAAQLAALRKVVEAIVAADPSHPFHLGITEVSVSESLSAASPAAVTATQLDIQQMNALNVTQAIDSQPGVEITRTVGRRNESYFNIRGFSSQGRVPLYLDGIPIYVPYDGNLDLNRFQASDIAEIEVARGFSSPLLGPGALGGSVNLVTREPGKTFEGSAAQGAFAGSGMMSSLRLGSRVQHYFVQGTLDWLESDYVPLSGNFAYPTSAYTGLATTTGCVTSGTTKICNSPYALNNRMNNSDSRDEKWSGRFGWTPKAGDEYVFSYINQKGRKSVPLYMGPATNYNFNAFWKWPYWNKNSYYFLGNKTLGAKSSLKGRVFYDQFRNSIDMYDNDQYSSMVSYTASKGSGSEHSKYDDHSDGASAEISTRLVKRNVLAASVFFKDDTHKEINIYPGAVAYTTATDQSAYYNPIKQLRSQQSSFGLLDQITLTSRLHATVGFSADHVQGLSQQSYKITPTYAAGTTTIKSVSVTLTPYTCAAEPSNTSRAGCMANGWTFNPQASLTYALTSSDVVSFTYEDRGNFPTLKQLYSASMGAGIPNPDLKSEHSRNFNFGYTRSFGTRTTASVMLYKMDVRNAIVSAYVIDPQWNLTTDPSDKLGLCPSGKTAVIGTTTYHYCSLNVNIGKESHEGVEATLHTRPLSRLTIDGNYSFLNRTLSAAEIPANLLNTASSPATSFILPLTGFPKHKLFTTATVRLPFNFDATVIERYQGGMKLMNYSNVYYRSAFATTDASFTFTANKRFLGIELPESKRITAQAGIKNLLDRNYYLADGFPEAGRNWFANLRYTF